MTTYCIAHCDNVLWALAPDDDEMSLKRQLQVYRDQLDMFEMGEREGDLTIERGLTLTDELQFDDDLRWTGGAHCGDLSVTPGLAFRYAVRRNKERIMDEMRETVETLIDLDEPEALLETLKRAAARQKGVRWSKLALALTFAQDKLEELHRQPGVDPAMHNPPPIEAYAGTERPTQVGPHTDDNEAKAE
jgi:hypothetical protein